MARPQLEFSPLLDWAEGRLSPQAAEDIELLLDGASATTWATVHWLQRFHKARQAVLLAAPPPETHDLLSARFAAYAATKRKPGLLQQLTAALSYDSRTQPELAFGTRSSHEAGGPRQMVFSCSVADIALNIHRRVADEQIDLSGQVLPHGTQPVAGWGVLLVGAHGPDVTQTDALGEFGFEAVFPGDYSLSLETPQLSIRMPLVSLVR